MEIGVYQGFNMDRSFRIHRVFTQADVHAVQHNPKAQVLATMMKPHHVLLSEIVDKVPMLAADGTDIQLQEVFLRHSESWSSQLAKTGVHFLVVGNAREGTVDITDEGEVVGAACTILFFREFPGTPAEILSFIATEILFGWHVADPDAEIAAMRAAVLQWHQEQDKAEGKGRRCRTWLAVQGISIGTVYFWLAKHSLQRLLSKIRLTIVRSPFPPSLSAAVESAYLHGWRRLSKKPRNSLPFLHAAPYQNPCLFCCQCYLVCSLH
jgi:hypothetical protein